MAETAGARLSPNQKRGGRVHLATWSGPDLARLPVVRRVIGGKLRGTALVPVSTGARPPTRGLVAARTQAGLGTRP
jgi:hypothetical protein